MFAHQCGQKAARTGGMQQPMHWQQLSQASATHRPVRLRHEWRNMRQKCQSERRQTVSDAPIRQRTSGFTGSGREKFDLLNRVTPDFRAIHRLSAGMGSARHHCVVRLPPSCNKSRFLCRVADDCFGQASSARPMMSKYSRNCNRHSNCKRHRNIAEDTVPDQANAERKHKARESGFQH